MVTSTSDASSQRGIGVVRPTIRMAAAATAQAETNHRPGSMTTAGGGGGTGLFTLQFFPGDERGPRDPDRDRHDRGAELDQRARDDDAGADEELPLHLHIIITNTAATMAENTRVGTVNGFVQ